MHESPLMIRDRHKFNAIKINVTHMVSLLIVGSMGIGRYLDTECCMCLFLGYLSKFPICRKSPVVSDKTSNIRYSHLQNPWGNAIRT